VIFLSQRTDTRIKKRQSTLLTPSFSPGAKETQSPRRATGFRLRTSFQTSTISSAPGKNKVKSELQPMTYLGHIEEGVDILLYPLFNFGPRWWYVVNATPLPLYSQESDSVPILQETGLASWSVCTVRARKVWLPPGLNSGPSTP
jgi:hypothetical protein